MKTIDQCLAMTRPARSAALLAQIGTLGNQQKAIAKLLFACEEKGDFAEGESLNAFAQRVTGVELRRECQGVYEAVNVLRAMKAGKVVMTETQFDSIRGFAVTTISSLLARAKDKVADAVKIALSGDKDVVKQLKELAGKKKSAPASAPSNESGDSEPADNVFIADFDEINAPTYIIPTSIVALNHEELLKRIVSEVKEAGSIEDCDAFLSMFDKLSAFAETRKETLEAERMTAARDVTGTGRTARGKKAPESAPLLPLELEKVA